MEMKVHGMASNLREYVHELMHYEGRVIHQHYDVDSVKVCHHFFFLQRLKVVDI
jgi:hypothetical protein